MKFIKIPCGFKVQASIELIFDCGDFIALISFMIGILNQHTTFLTDGMLAYGITKYSHNTKDSISGFYGNIPLVPVSYTHLRAHETRHDLVCRLLLEKKKNQL